MPGLEITASSRGRKRYSSIKTIQGNVKILQGVQYVPTLAHNLLSVGQLMKGCSRFYLTAMHV